LGIVTLLSTPTATTVAAAVIAIEARYRINSDATGPKRGSASGAGVMSSRSFDSTSATASTPAYHLGDNSLAEEQTKKRGRGCDS
jgi:hypothetical protein